MLGNAGDLEPLGDRDRSGARTRFQTKGWWTRGEQGGEVGGEKRGEGRDNVEGDEGRRRKRRRRRMEVKKDGVKYAAAVSGSLVGVALLPTFWRSPVTRQV